MQPLFIERLQGRMTPEDTTWHTPARISMFVDGVVFVAMTILILTVDLPATTAGADGMQLLGELTSVIPNVFAYVASFLVIALYWMGFNSHFHKLERMDGAMLWLVILFLLLIGFVPFATSLMGEHEGLVSTSIYSGVMIGIALVLVTMSSHARRRHLFGDAPLPPWLPTVSPWLKIIAVFSLSILVAALMPAYARLTYVLLAIPDAVFNRALGISARSSG